MYYVFFLTAASFLYPKNNGVKAQFNAKDPAYNMSAFPESPWKPSPVFQTRYDAYPILAYKVVHTGPNTQEGGLKTG